MHCSCLSSHEILTYMHTHTHTYTLYSLIHPDADNVAANTPTKSKMRMVFKKNIMGDLFCSSPTYSDTAMKGMIMEVVWCDVYIYYF